MIVLTGAGISKPSGIPTFEERPELRELLALEVWLMEPLRFWEVISDLYDECLKAKPNAAHMAIARAGVPVITQNIDGLHQSAGSREVIELHGNIHHTVCLQCGRRLPTKEAIDQKYKCYACQSWLKPDVVLYSEAVTNFPAALDAVERDDFLLVVGTSLAVYPAAALPEAARKNGARVAIINQNAEIEVPRFFQNYPEELPAI